MFVDCSFHFSLCRVKNSVRHSHYLFTNEKQSFLRSFFELSFARFHFISNRHSTHTYTHTLTRFDAAYNSLQAFFILQIEENENKKEWECTGFAPPIAYFLLIYLHYKFYCIFVQATIKVVGSKLKEWKTCSNNSIQLAVSCEWNVQLHSILYYSIAFVDSFLLFPFYFSLSLYVVCLCMWRKTQTCNCNWQKYTNHSNAIRLYVLYGNKYV